ncbi:hypothetical protein CALVIDRAFT_561232 [Calocera viscosa TUFC12733]|uniref:Uncharacterized protein n=1 Tax=Calocera viscosa (strain TUFC12733) TaxID=1330018 RepID=A0A167Q387_CALVF|nr:hypothetical protein CALVIDRAFT_561232 [Calocera viscosa TUFC12733]
MSVLPLPALYPGSSSMPTPSHPALPNNNSINPTPAPDPTRTALLREQSRLRQRRKRERDRLLSAGLQPPPELELKSSKPRLAPGLPEAERERREKAREKARERQRRCREGKRRARLAGAPETELELGQEGHTMNGNRNGRERRDSSSSAHSASSEEQAEVLHAVLPVSPGFQHPGPQAWPSNPPPPPLAPRSAPTHPPAPPQTQHLTTTTITPSPAQPPTTAGQTFSTTLLLALDSSPGLKHTLLTQLSLPPSALLSLHPYLTRAFEQWAYDSRAAQGQGNGNGKGRGIPRTAEEAVRAVEVAAKAVNGRRRT